MSIKPYSDKEMIAIMEAAKFPQWLTAKQLLMVQWWTVCNRRKLRRFCHELERGVAAPFAFRYAKQS